MRTLRLVMDSERPKDATEKLSESEMPFTVLAEETKEEWRKVEGTERYEVSNLGRIRSITYIKSRPNLSGYPYVNLWAKHRYKPRMIHRLVAQAFIPNPEKLPQVNHKDRNRQNPNVTNLEWVTHQGNMDHAWTNPLRASMQAHGENHGNSKFTSHQIICIRALAGVWRQRSMARMFGVTQHAIHAIIKREVWNHVSRAPSESTNTKALRTPPPSQKGRKRK